MPEFNGNISDFLASLRALKAAYDSESSKNLTKIPGYDGIRDPVRRMDLPEMEKIEIQPLQDLSVPGSIALDANTGDTFYTYKKGDTFSDVLKTLGLTTNNGLWGSDGDVAYYTQQLRDQGIRGNIPVGTTIRLKRRK